MKLLIGLGACTCVTIVFLAGAAFGAWWDDGEYGRTYCVVTRGTETDRGKAAGSIVEGDSGCVAYEQLVCGEYGEEGFVSKQCSR